MSKLGLVVGAASVVLLSPAGAAQPERREVTHTWAPVLERMGVRDPRVVAAMAAVSREAYLEPEERSRAWEDRPLPIGHGQTTSQPSLIALTLQAAKLTPGCRVLEVGTGCGYQTALLAKLCAEVYSIDIVAPLAERAQRSLAAQQVTNAHVKAGDGYLGWPEAAPFDAIIVAAGATRVPQPLVDQLAPGGRLLIPVGPQEAMELMVVTRRPDAGVATESLLPVRFVPLTGSHAERDRADAGHRRW